MATFPAIRIEGGLLGPDVLDQLLDADLPGQKPADFGLAGRRNLTDEVAAIFADARALWHVFQHRLQRLSATALATSVTRDAWGIPFLGLLGYEPRYYPRAMEVDGLTFAISHRAGEPEDTPPIHIVGARQELGRVAASGRPRLAPHSLVQEYLNRTEHLWGIVTNSLTLRLLRDSTFVRRQAYVEFDLTAILEESRFQDFAALYRLLHRTRLPRGMANADDCLLEQYYAHSVEQGGRVREHLRDGVEECIKRLANGFLRHPANDELRRRVSPACTGNERISVEDLYRQLLRLVYRFLFLLVSEDRGLLSPDPIYREHYSIARLRRLLENRAAYTEHDDLWQSLRVLWKVLSNDKFAALLELAPLNGELFTQLDLDACTLTNRDLLDAFWHLAWYQENPSSPPRRVNYAALDVEELGSVYESLLEFHPHLATLWNTPTFDLLLEGRERRSTGSHYTPPELVAPLIQHALEPVLEERIRAATTREQKECAILSLKVCDIACGSGHILLAAARRLGKELARVRTGEDEPAPERVREAIREIISHCIYGVDKNPLAVELCRVALWLESHAEGKPLTFLDHRVRCGDALVGVFDLEILDHGIPDEAFKPVAGDDRTAAREAKKRNTRERNVPLFHAPFAEQPKQMAERLRTLDDLPEDTIEQVRTKAKTYFRIERSPEFEQLQLACDIWTAAFFQPYPNAAGGPLTTEALRTALLSGRLADARHAGFVFQAAKERHFFHWPLAFPEALATGGFDVVLGNPPFLGGLKVSQLFGDKVRNFLISVQSPFHNRSDLCALFVRKAFDLLSECGRVGQITTNSISQGDTRESGLVPIVSRNGHIIFVTRFLKWPGQANVEVNLLAFCRGQYPQHRILDGKPVETISTFLAEEPEATPVKLVQSMNRSFVGDYVRGIGFVLDPVEARAILDRNPAAATCCLPYLSGEDINFQIGQKPSRYVICFHDWSLSKAANYSEPLKIVEQRVKPEREKAKQKRDRERWWLFNSYRRELRQAIRTLDRVLARSRVSELHMLAFVPTNLVASEEVIIFAFHDYYHFALLQSNIHEAWVWKNASSLESRNRYTPTDCFETFAFPQSPAAVARTEAERLGEIYHEHRRQVMLSRQLGLTKTYNLFHNPQCADADLIRMRELHVAIDCAILACYGWTDIDPGHGFHQSERGQTRYTIAPLIRREILLRLLELNLEVYNEGTK